MKCSEIHELFTDYADNALDRHRLTIFRNHLAACQDCGRQWQEFQQTVQLVQSLEPVPAPASLLASIQARLEKKSLFGRFLEFIERIDFSLSVPAAVTTFVIAMVGGFLLKNATIPGTPEGTTTYSLDRRALVQEKQPTFRLPRTSSRTGAVVAVSQGNGNGRTGSLSGLKALAAHPIPYENTSRPLSPDIRILMDCDREEGGRLSLYEEMLRNNWRLFQPAGDVLLLHLPQEDLPVLHAILASYDFQMTPASAVSRQFAQDKKVLTAVIRFL